MNEGLRTSAGGARGCGLFVSFLVNGLSEQRDVSDRSMENMRVSDRQAFTRVRLFYMDLAHPFVCSCIDFSFSRSLGAQLLQTFFFVSFFLLSAPLLSSSA